MGALISRYGRPLVVTALLVAALPSVALAAPAAPTLAGSLSNSVALSGATSTAVSGDYAYVTGYYSGELTAIDVSNPAAPVIAGSSAPSTALTNADTVNLAGGYAFAVSKNRNKAKGSGSNSDGTGNSLTILDISTNPAQPAIVGTVTDPNTLFGAYGVAVLGHYAFVASQGCLGGQPCPSHSVGNSFAVVDISSPGSPKVVAAIHNNALPAPWRSSAALAHATSVAISGNYAYVTAAYNDTLTVIDISTPTSPKIVGVLKDTTNLNFPVDVAVSGQYAYVVDQINTGRVTVVNVSNPTHPAVVTSLANAALNGAYRIRIRGDFAYVAASSTHAITAVDISNPLSLRVAASYSDATRLNHTTGLDVSPSGAQVITTSPLLSSQLNATYPPFPLQPGGPTVTGTVSAITLDPFPIAVSIASSSEPPPTTTQTTADFSFGDSDQVAAVQCKLDGASLGPCTTSTSMSYAALAASSHTFTVQAVDAAGNIASASYTWTVT